MYFYKCSWIIFVCCIFFSCTNHMQERIQYTLHQAGENSSELKKVLDHYLAEPVADFLAAAATGLMFLYKFPRILKRREAELSQQGQ